MVPTYVEIIPIIVGSTDPESFQQLQIWFSEHFLRQNVLCSLSLILFLLQCYEYGAKKCPNTMFDSTFEMSFKTLKDVIELIKTCGN